MHFRKLVMSRLDYILEVLECVVAIVQAPPLAGLVASPIAEISHMSKHKTCLD